MKKLVLSLLGAATLATASNAMALDTRQLYMVTIATRGVVPTFAGEVAFDFDSELFAMPPSLPGGPVGNLTLPGSCVYSAQWLSNNPFALGGQGANTPLTLSAQCFVAEQMVHGAGGCIGNALTAVPTTVTAVVDPNWSIGYGPCYGFNPFGQIDTIIDLQLGEIGWPTEAFTGIVQFDSMLTNHTVYGIQLSS